MEARLRWGEQGDEEDEEKPTRSATLGCWSSVFFQVDSTRSVGLQG